jgi:hypothetical protein
VDTGFPKKIMRNKEMPDEHDSTQLKHALGQTVTFTSSTSLLWFYNDIPGGRKPQGLGERRFRLSSAFVTNA